MTALDTLKATQARIIKLREDAAKSSKDADDLERETCLAIEVAQDYEDKTEEKKMYDSEALSTLYVKIVASIQDNPDGETYANIDAAFRAFTESASLEIPSEITPTEKDDVQAVAEAPT